MKRNLLFHLYPKQGSCWKWHVEQLLAYQSAWNGRRIVVLVVDDWVGQLNEILVALEPLKATLMVGENDASLGETKYFLQALKQLESTDPDEATFYAHGKGTTREGSELGPVMLWSKAMYALNLGRIEAIEKRLATAATVGAFRVQIRHSGAPWCFAGTFFWLKHSALFSRKWNDIEKGRWGVEGYPGRVFKFEESVSLTPKIVPDMSMPAWLYGRDGSGVTEGHIKQWQEKLWRES